MSTYKTVEDKQREKIIKLQLRLKEAKYQIEDYEDACRKMWSWYNQENKKSKYLINKYLKIIE